MTGELTLFGLLVGVIAIAGVALGILAAPALSRLTDRLGHDDDDEERDG